jgi:hypothetical protein
MKKTLVILNPVAKNSQPEIFLAQGMPWRAIWVCQGYIELETKKE